MNLEEHKFLYQVPQGTFFAVYDKQIRETMQGEPNSLVAVLKSVKPSWAATGRSTDVWVRAYNSRQLQIILDHSESWTAWASRSEAKQFVLEMEATLKALQEVEARHPFYDVPDFNEHFDNMKGEFNYTHDVGHYYAARMKTEGDPGFLPRDVEARLKGYTPEVLNRPQSALENVL